MPDLQALTSRASDASRLLSRLAAERKRVLVVTHIDADGLSSGAIAFQTLIRAGAIASVRAIPDLDLRAIEGLGAEKFDFYLFTDLGSGLVDALAAALGQNFLVVDHHQLPPEHYAHPCVINAWAFGYDGGTEVCSSTMAYFLALAFGEANKDLSTSAVVGALGDRQDNGPGRSLTGLNRRPLEDGLEKGVIVVSKDFLFHGRETRPIHEALAMTYTPYLVGLSGAKDACLAALTNTGFVLKEHGRWRNLAELTDGEKAKLLELLTSFVGAGAGGSAVIAEVIGEIYSLRDEDALTPLHDAREFATLLNACGRMDATDVGIAISLGDREGALAQALRLTGEYRVKIGKALQTIQTVGDRISTHGDVAVVVGDEFIEERMAGSISSLLASSERLRDKMVLVRARSGETELKFSCRLGDAFPKEVNLGLVMKEAAELVGGVGGGHRMAAGAKISITKGDEFTRAVLQRFSQ
ncbi:MAG: DHH family phosphoesterase [Nitrososphaerales archaeon]